MLGKYVLQERRNSLDEVVAKTQRRSEYGNIFLLSFVLCCGFNSGSIPMQQTRASAGELNMR